MGEDDDDFFSVARDIMGSPHASLAQVDLLRTQEMLRQRALSVSGVSQMQTYARMNTAFVPNAPVSYQISYGGAGPERDYMAENKQTKMMKVLTDKVNKLKMFMTSFSRSEILAIVDRKERDNSLERHECEIIRHCTRQLENGRGVSIIADSVFYGFDKLLP